VDRLFEPALVQACQGGGVDRGACGIDGLGTFGQALHRLLEHDGRGSPCAQGDEVRFAVLALGLGGQRARRAGLERVEPAQGDVAADVGRLARGRKRRQLGAQPMVERRAVVVDPRDDDAREIGAVGRRLGRQLTR
jgi:hypothetical protein